MLARDLPGGVTPSVSVAISRALVCEYQRTSPVPVARCVLSESPPVPLEVISSVSYHPSR